MQTFKDIYYFFNLGAALYFTIFVFIEFWLQKILTQKRFKYLKYYLKKENNPINDQTLYRHYQTIFVRLGCILFSTDEIDVQNQKILYMPKQYLASNISAFFGILIILLSIGLCVGIFCTIIFLNSKQCACVFKPVTIIKDYLTRIQKINKIFEEKKEKEQKNKQLKQNLKLWLNIDDFGKRLEEVL